MMQVEEKPDVTYSDVGGCKEQIDKLREVVETPLLHVSTVKPVYKDHLRDWSESGLYRQVDFIFKVACFNLPLDLVTVVLKFKVSSHV